jgi:hypothetical protein
VVEPDDQSSERVCRCARGVPSCSCDSWPSHEAVGGLVVDFEPSRTASGPSRLDAVRTASNSKRNHPRRREMDTSRIEEVKAPPHDVTPYSRRLPGPARPHGHLHAREDSDAEDLADPDLPRAPVAEDPRKCMNRRVDVDLELVVAMWRLHETTSRRWRRQDQRPRRDATSRAGDHGPLPGV